VGFIPGDVAKTLAHPTHVEAYRTGEIADHPGFGGKMEGYAVFDTGMASDETARDLAAAFADPATYLDASGPSNFEPTVGYRFYRQLDGGRGQWSVDVLIGFDTDQVLMVGRDNKQREDFRRMLVSVPGRTRLLELSREAFPLDTAVQEIQDFRAPDTQVTP
jgi:hypothetical protein